MNSNITVVSGNLIHSKADAIVNTVNCVGVMGKGLALDFKRAHPDNFLYYQEACRRGELRPGGVLVYELGSAEQRSLFDGGQKTRFIFNVATKKHWRFNSRPSDVQAGIRRLAELCQEHNIGSIAVPPMGCGLGGLDWQVVRPLVIEGLSKVPGLEVMLYDPPELNQESLAKSPAERTRQRARVPAPF